MQFIFHGTGCFVIYCVVINPVILGLNMRCCIFLFLTAEKRARTMSSSGKLNLFVYSLISSMLTLIYKLTAYSPILNHTVSSSYAICSMHSFSVKYFQFTYLIFSDQTRIVYTVRSHIV